MSGICLSASHFSLKSKRSFSSTPLAVSFLIASARSDGVTFVKSSENKLSTAPMFLGLFGPNQQGPDRVTESRVAGLAHEDGRHRSRRGAWVDGLRCPREFCRIHRGSLLPIFVNNVAPYGRFADNPSK